MAMISVLDQNTINKIAAGEVIERPASIVKELLENAIDAGATAVTVEIKEGGISFIRITDNGCGIPKDQIALAFLRHSTSKIRTVEDLITVSSLGFRGEALSSIAAIAQVELITKPAQALTGVCYSIEGGKEVSLEEIGAPDGTTFLIRNVFYNTPARKKFLKSPTTEGGYITDLVERIALSRPDISMRLIVNGQNKLYTTGNGKLKDLIYTIYGRDITANVVPVDAKDDVLAIHGFIGKPVIARGNRSFENYFINGRYIKSSLIAKAIETAYKPYMMLHRYPFTVLHLTIPSDLLDVNVHPTKMELRFKNEEDIFQKVVNMLTAALSGKEFIPEISLEEKKEEKTVVKEAPEPFEKKRLELEEVKRLATYGKEEKEKLAYKQNKFQDVLKKYVSSEKENEKKDGSLYPNQVKEKEEYKYSTKEAGGQGKQETDRLNQDLVEASKADSDDTNQEIYLIAPAEGKAEQKDANEGLPVSREEKKEGQQLTMFEPNLLSKEGRKKHRLVGQVFDTYWIVQFEDKLFIIDQHAAHEKVLYERTMTSIAKKEFTSQMVSPPIIITLNNKEEEVLKKYRNNFTDLGFEIAFFGGKEYAISAVPGNLFGVNDRDLFIEMLDNLTDDLGLKSSDVITEKIASLSCKAAVKGNHTMTFREMDELIGQLMTLENPYACPHGRPTIISMSRYELEKKFKRIV